MKFTRNVEWKRHQRCKHTFRKPFECNDCNIRFFAKSNLIRHQRRKHKFDKHFKCFLWNKQFLAKYLRKIHLQTHIGQKLSKC